MIHIVLYQPQIPPNTGNIIRLCANTGATLHLIEPLGFSLDEKSCRRAGLDYHELAEVRRWPSFEAFQDAVAPASVWVVTKFGSMRYDRARFHAGDALLFGNEPSGLPQHFRNSFAAETQLYLPMKEGARSLNLSNAVSVLAYEALRQIGFD